MAARHSKLSKAEQPRYLIPAVGYVRRSSDKQERSLSDQRREIEKYAEANAYRIVDWYEDDAISGDDTERRLGFKAMHSAAIAGSAFEAILVWDIDRFGRFNSMEAGYWNHPLMKAGVRLVAVNEGVINWNEFAGRVMYTLKQEGKHQFLHDLSRNSTRGRITTARKGFLCGQAAPYGYDRMMVDANGVPQQRVDNGDQCAKPRNWNVTLVPSEDVQKVETLRWLFQTYSEQDIGMRAMVRI